MEESQGSRVLKRDVFGWVERARVDGRDCVRRRAVGSRVPFSRVVARALLARERAALERLAGLDGVPRLVDSDAGSRAEAHAESDTGTGADADGARGRPDPEVGPDARGVLTRAFVAGTSLAEATWLPVNFFEELDRLVEAVHARGVCHNDLHKEPNVLVDARGYPWLVDFQLASVHPRRDRRFAARALEDLRHVEKHRRRYTRDGRGPGGVQLAGRGTGSRRSFVARAWRSAGKPLYNFVAHRLVRAPATEVRRPITGPWPEWRAPVPPRVFG